MILGTKVFAGLTGHSLPIVHCKRHMEPTLSSNIESKKNFTKAILGQASLQMELDFIRLSSVVRVLYAVYNKMQWMCFNFFLAVLLLTDFTIIVTEVQSIVIRVSLVKSSNDLYEIRKKKNWFSVMKFLVILFTNIFVCLLCMFIMSILLHL